jgi:hypothetical protein
VSTDASACVSRWASPHSEVVGPCSAGARTCPGTTSSGFWYRPATAGLLLLGGGPTATAQGDTNGRRPAAQQRVSRELRREQDGDAECCQLAGERANPQPSEARSAQSSP